ncbi:MAG: type I methionyl aminopeptidase [Anaerolineae bacterium]|nr:type I methionyl aminopeptidase [Anaerolineae bacterium]
MTIENEKDLAALRRIGQICGLTLQHMLSKVEPGMTTAQLDDIGKEFLMKHNARSAPILAYKFPGWTCLSINDVAAHGIPGSYKIQPGDVVNVDVSAELEGYWADTAATMIVPPASPEHKRLCKFTQRALAAGIKEAKAGQRINQIGKAVEDIARRGGYTIIRALPGHGVGRHIHEKPSVYNFYNRRDKTKLTEGLVITIEPFLSMGNGRIFTEDDEWTLRAVDGSISAQYEHTVVITKDDPILITAV